MPASGGKLRGGGGMNVSSLLISRLKTLRLSGILESLDVRLEQAGSGSLGYREFLELIVQDETERRVATRLNQRLKKAAFEEPKASSLPRSPASTSQPSRTLLRAYTILYFTINISF